MDEAKSLLQGHPHISGWSTGATIEVHEAMPYRGCIFLVASMRHESIDIVKAAE